MEDEDASASLDMEAVKRRLAKEDDGVAEDEDDEIDSEIYGIEDEEEESADIQQRLAESSSGEDQKMEGEKSDIDSDEEEAQIIKMSKKSTPAGKQSGKKSAGRR
jgi:hypothetical protein